MLFRQNDQNLFVPSCQHEDEILLLPGIYLEVIGKIKLAERFSIIRMHEAYLSHVLLKASIDSEPTQNIEFILGSIYEVNKEDDHTLKSSPVLLDLLRTWNRTNPMKNKFVLYFVCECSIKKNSFSTLSWQSYSIFYSFILFLLSIHAIVYNLPYEIFISVLSEQVCS